MLLRINEAMEVVSRALAIAFPGLGTNHKSLVQKLVWGPGTSYVGDSLPWEWGHGSCESNGEPQMKLCLSHPV